jgi:hypothetical protein
MHWEVKTKMGIHLGGKVLKKSKKVSFIFAWKKTNIKLPSCKVSYKFMCTIKLRPMSDDMKENEKISAPEKKLKRICCFIRIKGVVREFHISKMFHYETFNLMFRNILS